METAARFKVESVTVNQTHDSELDDSHKYQEYTTTIVLRNVPWENYENYGFNGVRNTTITITDVGNSMISTVLKDQVGKEVDLSLTSGEIMLKEIDERQHQIQRRIAQEVEDAVVARRLNAQLVASGGGKS